MLFITLRTSSLVILLWLVGLVIFLALIALIYRQMVQRKQLEKELKEIEKMLETNVEYEFVLKAMRLATWHVDPKMRSITFENDFRENNDNFTPEAGTNIDDWISQFLPSDQARVTKALDDMWFVDDLLENFGGHTYAVGLTLRKENIPEFRRRFQDYVSHHILPEQTQQTLDIDLELDFHDVNKRLLNELKRLAPHGPGNDKPLFITRNVYDYGTSKVVGRHQEHIKLELVLGPNPSDLLQPGDTISGGLQKGVMGLAAGMVPQIQAMLPKLDSILMNVNLLLSDPALKNSLHHIDQITGNLTTTTNELNTMAQALNRQMPSLIKNADGMLANANDLTRNLNELDLAATMAKVNNTLQNVEQMTAKLNSNEGTLGLLMRDADLYNNMNATMMHADSLMIDLKAHPKRYVHFSVFGRKDK